jgi:fluoride exporter
VRADGEGGFDAVDPDVDLHLAAQRSELRLHPGLLLGAVAVGGVLGSEARYGLSVAFPDESGVPWTTLAINVAGSLLLGALMVAVQRWGSRLPLLRPFAGVGVLGGFTTFSAYAVGVQRLLAGGFPAPAVVYLVLTPLLAVPAVLLGSRIAGAVLRAPAPQGRPEVGR